MPAQGAGTLGYQRSLRPFARQGPFHCPDVLPGFARQLEGGGTSLLRREVTTAACWEEGAPRMRC